MICFFCNRNFSSNLISARRNKVAEDADPSATSHEGSRKSHDRTWIEFLFTNVLCRRSSTSSPRRSPIAQRGGNRTRERVGMARHVPGSC